MLRLLLLVSRRSSRSRPFPAPREISPSFSSGVASLSLLRESFLRGVRLGDLDIEGDLEMDLDMELVLRRDRRDRGGGDGDKDADEDLLLFVGGDLEREISEGVGDLRRGPRSGLLPLPRPPRPRYILLRLSGDLFLRRGGERDLEGERRLPGGDSERDPEADLAEAGDLDFDGDGLLRSVLLSPRRSLGT